MKLKILIVDDKIPFLDSVIRYLNLHPNIELISWSLSGLEAISKVQLFNPDLILIDLSLPDINGLEVIKEIKRLSSEQKIVVLTLFDDLQYRNEAKAAGADGFLSKNDFVIQFSDLINKLFN